MGSVCRRNYSYAKGNRRGDVARMERSAIRDSDSLFHFVSFGYNCDVVVNVEDHTSLPL
jgi:hypothetical protein